MRMLQASPSSLEPVLQVRTGAVERQRVVAAPCRAALAQDPDPPPASTSLGPLPFLPTSLPASLMPNFSSQKDPGVPRNSRPCWPPAPGSPAPPVAARPWEAPFFQEAAFPAPVTG